MKWEINLHPAVVQWLEELAEVDPLSVNLIEEALAQLADEGPTAGRPLVDRIQGSRFHNMKELRPASTGRSEVRILFAFDPQRRAIMLVSGDKAGRWQSWYRKAIPIADERFAEHLQSLESRSDDD